MFDREEKRESDKSPRTSKNRRNLEWCQAILPPLKGRKNHLAHGPKTGGKTPQRRFEMERKILLTVEETARALNVKVSWIRSAIFHKKIPYLKVGNHVRFEEKELIEWLEKRREGLVK